MLFACSVHAHNQLDNSDRTAKVVSNQQSWFRQRVAARRWPNQDIHAINAAGLPRHAALSALRHWRGFYGATQGLRLILISLVRIGGRAVLTDILAHEGPFP